MIGQYNPTKFGTLKNSTQKRFHQFVFKKMADAESKDNAETKNDNKQPTMSEQKNNDRDEENPSMKLMKKKEPRTKSFGVPSSVSEKSKSHRERTGPGHHTHFRKNLNSFQEALGNHQYDLGSNEIKKEDIEVNHDQSDHTTHMRSNWHDGTGGGEYEELLQDLDSAVHNSGGGADHGQGKRGSQHGRNLMLAKQPKRQLYVESATGFFKRVRGGVKSHHHRDMGGVRPGHSSEDVYARYYRTKAALDPRERTMWLFAQGLLAGFSSAPVILQVKSACLFFYCFYCHTPSHLSILTRLCYFLVCI
jgi:hypothetical protein